MGINVKDQTLNLCLFYSYYIVCKLKRLTINSFARKRVICEGDCLPGRRDGTPLGPVAGGIVTFPDRNVDRWLMGGDQDMRESERKREIERDRGEEQE